MRIAIISDIHSNLEALQKVEELINKMDVDKIVCLGDIVGYGANPQECLKIVRELTPHIVMGNHDQAAASLAYTKTFTPFAKTAAVWTNAMLSESEKKFLLNLPLSIELEGITFVHASPHKPSEWKYVTTEEEAFENFGHMKTGICFIGHSHVAKIYSSDWESLNISNNIHSRKLMKGTKYIINPGSVGQPRDLDWRLSFGIIDTTSMVFEFVRSEYDVHTAADKILKAKLPKYLAERLPLGR
jgi:putative phosphoesterase